MGTDVKRMLREVKMLREVQWWMKSYPYFAVWNFLHNTLLAALKKLEMSKI